MGVVYTWQIQVLVIFHLQAFVLHWQINWFLDQCGCSTFMLIWCDWVTNSLSWTDTILAQTCLNQRIRQSNWCKLHYELSETINRYLNNDKADEFEQPFRLPWCSQHQSWVMFKLHKSSVLNRSIVPVIWQNLLFTLV